MKNTSALKNTTRSILIASVMFGVTGMVHAQSSSTAKKQAAPSRARPRTHTVKMQHGTMQSRKDQAHIRMEKTNRPTMRSRKVRDYTHMEKIHQAITQGRKDQAPRDGPLGWDRVLRKARAPQEGINYGLSL